MPTRATYHSAATLGGYLYAIGGYDSYTNVYRYQPGLPTGLEPTGGCEPTGTPEPPDVVEPPEAGEPGGTILKFPQAAVTFAPDIKRQAIVDSWPADIDDSAARADWGWQPDYDAERAFSEYLIPAVIQRYAGKPAVR